MAVGVFSLGDISVTTAATQTGTPIIDLDGMMAATVQVRLAYGSGGSTIRCYVQTSLDQGTTWIDIAAILFGTASETAVFNFSKATPKTTQITPTDGALSDDTAVDGVLGDRLRIKIISAGTSYANSTYVTGRVAVS